MRDKNEGPKRAAGLRALLASCMVTLALVAYSYVGVRSAHAEVAGCTGDSLSLCNAFCSDTDYFCCFENSICFCTNSEYCD